jgi:prophage regulatory protein
MSNGTEVKMSKRFIRLDEVMAQTGLCRSAIYAGMESGTFPASFNIGTRSVAWLEADIDGWKRNVLEAAGKRLMAPELTT